MKKIGFLSFAALAVLLFCQTASAEARGHSHRRNTRVEINIGGCGGCREAYVVRRYAAPVVPVVYAPVGPFAAPMYVPAYPTYVEEVYTQPVRRPFSLAGISLTWNLFR